MRNGIIRKKMQKTVLKQGVQITLRGDTITQSQLRDRYYIKSYGAV